MAFGLSGGDRASSVGSVLLGRKLISCNQMLWITVFVSSALTTEAKPTLIQQHYLVFCKASNGLLNKEVFYVLHFVVQNTAYCCFEIESYDFVSDYVCKALFGEGKENDSKTEEILVTSKNEIIKQSRVSIGKAIPGIGTSVEIFFKNNYYIMLNSSDIKVQS